MIVLKNITKKYNGEAVLNKINLEIKDLFSSLEFLKQFSQETLDTFRETFMEALEDAEGTMITSEDYIDTIEIFLSDNQLPFTLEIFHLIKDRIKEAIENAL